ncbi:Zinc-transporting ATPase [Bacteroidales bacterium Barb7]|nr:Zinc-transporting ATPase [Bacteroidales bacterium Barb4]OAV74642.1 Zinc-transporting ATPase [Bacteroidales bacterium Barb7]
MKTKLTKLFVCLFALCTLVCANAAAQDKKADKKKKTAEVTFVVSMFCENCKAKIERHIAWEKGVKELNVNLDKKLVTIGYDPSKTNEEALKKALEALEYTCEKPDESPTESK